MKSVDVPAGGLLVPDQILKGNLREMMEIGMPPKCVSTRFFRASGSVTALMAVSVHTGGSHAELERDVDWVRSWTVRRSDGKLPGTGIACGEN